MPHRMCTIRLTPDPSHPFVWMWDVVNPDGYSEVSGAEEGIGCAIAMAHEHWRLVEKVRHGRELPELLARAQVALAERSAST